MLMQHQRVMGLACSAKLSFPMSFSGHRVRRYSALAYTSRSLTISHWFCCTYSADRGSDRRRSSVI